MLGAWEVSWAPWELDFQTRFWNREKRIAADVASTLEAHENTAQARTVDVDLPVGVEWLSRHC